MKIKSTLWQHQVLMHDVMEKSLKTFGYGWLLAGCRTGKTLVSLALIATLKVRKILVITLVAPMNDTWPSEVQTHTEGLNYFVLNKGNSAAKAKAMRLFLEGISVPRIVVVNYETAVLMSDAIAAADFDMVICDESQKLMSEDSNTSRGLARACSRIQYKLELTGTPWEDHIKGVYGQVRFMSPILKGKKTVHSELLGTWGSFMYNYCETYKMGNVEIIKGYKNKEKLAAILRPFIHYVKTEDVLDLPPVRYITRKVPMLGELKRMYQELDQEMITTFGPDYLVGDNRLVCELRLHQLTGGFVTPMRIDENGKYVKAAAVPTAVPDKSGDVKLDALLDLVEEFGDERFVVVTRFTSDVDKIKKALEKQGKKVLMLTGAVKENDLFEQGIGDCLIMNIQAGNAGIRLTSAHLVIDYTIGNSRTQYIQSRYRFLANGLDKTKAITYHALVMEGSVDEDIFARMQAKEDSSNSLLDLILDKEAVIE